MISEILSLVVVLGLLIIGLSLGQYGKYFILRRWRRRVTPPDPSFFPSKISFATGETLRFFVHSSQAFEFRLYRISYPDNELVASSHHEPVIQSASYDYWTGCRWTRSLDISPEGVTPGFYIVEVRQKYGASAFRASILVRSRQAKIAVVASTNTWQAYNAYAGLSNYSLKGISFPLILFVYWAKLFNLGWRLGDRHYIPIIPLPKHRPNLKVAEDLSSIDPSDWGSFSHAGFSHTARSECHLIRLLEKLGIDYTVISDEDFGRHGSAGIATSGLIFNSHSEYWSSDMMGQLSILISRGLGIAFFSGNNMYRTVEITNSSINVIDQKAEQRRMAEATGLAFDHRGIGTYADYEIVTPGHPFFDGLDLSTGDVLADKDNDNLIRASGHETDKLWPVDGQVRVLAMGANDDGPAAIIHRRFENGAWLLNVGSVSFVQTIHGDSKVTKFTENVVKALAEHTPSD